MAKQATASKPTKAWGWSTPAGKIYKGAFESKAEATYHARDVYGPEGFKVFQVWVNPVKK